MSATERRNRRRPKGEGTVYFDKARNRWIGAVTIGGKRRKVSGRDKTEARAELAKLLAAKTTDSPVANRSITVGQTIDRFLERGLEGRTGRPLAPSTIALYRWSANIARNELGTVRLAELTVDDVEAMLDNLARHDGFSAASLRKVRSTLKRSIDFAIRRGDAIRNVATVATITPSAATPTKRKVLTPSQARKLLEVLQGERLGPMYAIQLRLALRPGEAAGLHWEDLHDNALNITRAVRLVDGHPTVVDDLKTEAARRTIELPAELVDQLATHRTAQVAERLAAATWVDDRLMFATRAGTPLSPSNVRRDLARICARANLPSVTPNELRHSCASLLSDAGVPNEQIADLLGHTTTRMVDQTYRHRLRPVVDVAARTDWTQSR